MKRWLVKQMHKAMGEETMLSRVMGSNRNAGSNRDKIYSPKSSIES